MTPVSTDKSAYSSEEMILASFEGLAGNPTDWIVVARADAPATDYLAWLYLGEASGSRAFSAAKLSGSYVIRIFENNTYNMIAESAAFTVAVAGQSVTTTASSYSVGATITASYNALPGNAKDWLALAPQGSPNSHYSQWAYVSGASGVHHFAPPAPGTYVVRAFENDGLTLLRESAPFVVGYGKPTTNKPSYTPGETVSVNYSGLPGNERDWITVAPESSPLTTFGAWSYIAGASGSHDFTGLSAGNYVVRAFENDGFTLLSESTPFTIAFASTTISSDASSYVPGSSVTISFANLRGNARDWITLAPSGSPLSTYGAWAYPGSVNGTHVFHGVAAGSYVARAFDNDSFSLLAESTEFVIAAPAKNLAASAPSYSAGALVTIAFANMPGNPTDWIAIAPSGSANTSFTTWRYLSSGNGSEVFQALPAGQYVARVFENNGYNLLGESAPFTVNGGSAVRSSKASYASSEPLVVSFGGMPGNHNDWIAIASVGSAEGSFSTWAYTYGQNSGSVTFPSGLPAGEYTARMFFNDGSSMQAESTAFSIVAP